MKFQGTVLKEQGITFAIVIVKQSAIQSQMAFQSAANVYQKCFPGMPLVLMAQDNRGRPTYRGRNDIVNFLANINPSRIPWKEYTYS